MKKNIPINIASILFYIEEDAYDQLKNYLDSINKYFSSYDESREIINDIESRIAEIFSDTLGPLKQVIKAEDVENLIKQMGTITDFQEQEEIYGSEKDSTQEEPLEEDFVFEKEPHLHENTKKAYRDKKRALLGGVASGIAHFIGIDPIWIRLLFLLFFLGFPFINYFASSSFIIYILLWAILPGRDDLEEQQHIKKFFRDPDDKVMAGIAGGIAAYFGWEVNIVRLLLVLSIFLGGTGILIYLVLWMITPQAETITEKMQMKGEPINLKNIEEAIKRSFNLKDDKETNNWIKLLILPFQLLAAMMKAISPYLNSVINFGVDALKIITGSILLLISFSGIISIFLALLIGLDILDVKIGNIPPYLYDSIPYQFELIYSIFFTILIPFIGIGILGLMLLIQRSVLPKMANWILSGLWVLAFSSLIIFASFTGREFTEKEEVEKTMVYDTPAQKLELGINESVGRFGISLVSLKIKGHESKEIKIVQKITAYGSDKEDASLNTQMLDYNITQKEGRLIFDEYYLFKEGARFRGQAIELTLYIPNGKRFIMSQDLERILRQTIHVNGYQRSDIGGNTWYFEQGKLICETCKKKPKSSEREDEEEEEQEEDRGQD